MKPSRVSDPVVGSGKGGLLGRRGRVRFGSARQRGIALAVGALALALGAGTAYALFLQLGQFGSQGSGSGQFQTPKGVAVDQATGDVYVADSGNARVQKFDGTGVFIAAWGYGVTDGMAVSQVCTTTCQAGIPARAPGSSPIPRASRSTAPAARRTATCTSVTSTTTSSRSSTATATSSRRSMAAPQHGPFRIPRWRCGRSERQLVGRR